jgi:hypothetical protein
MAVASQFRSQVEEILKQTKNHEIIKITSCAGNYGPKRNYSALWDYGPHELSMIYGLSGLGLEINTIENLYNENGSSHFFSFNKNGAIYSTTKIWNDHLPKTRYFEVVTKEKKFIYNDIIENKLMINGNLININNTLPLNNSLAIFLKAIKNNIEMKYQPGYLSIDNVEIVKKLKLIENYR